MEAPKQAKSARRRPGMSISSAEDCQDGSEKRYIDTWNDRDVRVYWESQHGSKRAPVFGLWRNVTGTMPALLSTLPKGCHKHIILPLCGGQNPFWRDHWTPHGCRQSSLLDTFRTRVLSFYGINDDQKFDIHEGKAIWTGGGGIKIIIIARGHNRRIINMEDHVRAIHEKYPSVNVAIVKLENYSIEDQLRLVRHTDVLIGVLGAGLTHILFQRPGSVVVELQHPRPFRHCVFANTAHMAQVEYLWLRGEGDGFIKDGHWQLDDMAITEERFVDMIGKAIEAVRTAE
ncbi:hypothetical protein ABW21_db0209742 [Orbilia brochopaga]|nr:hypothetical protein ABW21_db0209742 [Drechslerella brochopaga]